MIFEQDIGYMFALAETLQKSGYFTVPASTWKEAESLLDALGVMADALLVNPDLPEAEIVGSRLRERNPALRIIPLDTGWIPSHIE